MSTGSHNAPLAMRCLRTTKRVRIGTACAASLSVLLVTSCSQAPHAVVASSTQAPTLIQTPGTSATAHPDHPLETVTVDIIARTRHYKPVLDLDASHVAVSDDGSPVQLTSLHRVDLTSGPRHLAAFLFDRMEPADANTARNTAEKVLAVIPDQGYSLAVLQVGGRLRLLKDYSADFPTTRAALMAATPLYPTLPSNTLTLAESALIGSAQSTAINMDPFDRARSKLLLSALQESQRMMQDRLSHPALAALQSLVLSDRLLEGRKFIFFFCNGISSDSDATDRLQSIVSLASRIDVTIYVIDVSQPVASMDGNRAATQASSILGNANATGGVTAFGANSANVSSPLLTAVLSKNVTNFEFGDIEPDQSPLVALTSGTGGMYINALDDSRRKLQELHEELTTWYQASWASPIQSYDGQFRPIDIHSQRKDIVVRSRSGYFAVPSSEFSEMQPFETPLLKLLSASTPPSDLPTHAAILHLGRLPDGNSAEFVVQVPISQLEVHEDANTHTSTVQASIVAVIKDSEGNILQRFAEDFPIHKAPEMFHVDSGEMITLARSFSAEPGTYTLDAIVMDRLANKAGTQHIAFTMEPPSSGPALSDIALVQSIEPVEEAHDTYEPMRYRDGRIVARSATDISGKTSSLPFFFLLHPVAGSLNQPTLRMQIYRDTRLLSDVPMDLHAVSGSGAAIPYLATINGNIFPPGKYQVKALFTQNGTTASSVASFHIASDLTSSSRAASSPTEPDLLSATPSGSFTITPSASPIPPPSESESATLLESARQRALAWSASIQNFLCVEVTRHFVDTTGQAAWKQKGTLVERLQYVDHTQTRSTIQLNGEASRVSPDQLDFFHSSGEFGSMFHIIFDPSAKASLTWKQAAFIEGQPVQVFAFSVDRSHSSFNLTDRDGHVAAVGFSGLLFIDPATGNVRRVSISADDIPPTLLIRSCSMSVDYARISMQNHDFLLPIHGAVGMHETKRHPVLNEFTFRSYRRFGSQVHILSVDEIKDLSKN
jgi:VWFA-related protein